LNPRPKAIPYNHHESNNRRCHPSKAQSFRHSQSSGTSTS
jgi:hypothetical protein